MGRCRQGAPGGRSGGFARLERQRQPPGLRDAAIIRVMSDTLARISEVVALRCADVEADATGGGTVLFRASKSARPGCRLGSGGARRR